MNSMGCIFLFLVSLLLISAAVVGADPATGFVTGRIDCQAAADCLGVAALWRADEKIVPAPDRYLLTPAVVSALDADGSFELIAPIGDYYVGAQLRETPGPLFGAPRVDDRIYLMKEQDDVGYRVTVAAGQTTDTGLHAIAWTFRGMTEFPQMGISGQVLDVDKQPVAGLLVFAFADSGAATSPLAVSSRTGADGSFVLPLATPGAVYLRARKNYRGGQPQADGYVGVSAGIRLQPVTVERDQVIDNVRVFVRKLPSVLVGKNAPDTARPKFQ